MYMGLVKDQKVKVKIGPSNLRYYQNLGYEIPMKESAKLTRTVSGTNQAIDYGKEIEVDVLDLSSGSRAIIQAICDMCGDTIQRTMKSYNESMKTCGHVYCQKCAHIQTKLTMKNRYGYTSTLSSPVVRAKIRETIKQKYGGPSAMNDPKVVEKRKQNNRKKYGVDHVMQLEENKEKSRKTCLERYGVPNCIQDPGILAKMKQTFLDKYGVTNPGNVPEIREKIMKTSMERWGTPYPFQNDIVREKIAQSLNGSDKVATSTQQKYLHELYGGVLNGAVRYYNCDIVLYDEHIVIEYDGSGHDASVRFYKSISEEDFLQREIKRSYVIKQEGFNRMVIISNRDYLPYDDMLLYMLDYARNYFESGHSWIKYDIDSSIVINDLNPNGFDFDFGDLRKIKKKEEVNVVGSNN